MKNLLLVVTFAIACAAAIASCGGDPCEELADICAGCMDESTKSGCRARANADDHDQCETALDTYRMQCGG